MDPKKTDAQRALEDLEANRNNPDEAVRLGYMAAFFEAARIEKEKDDREMERKRVLALEEARQRNAGCQTLLLFGCFVVLVLLFLR